MPLTTLRISETSLSMLAQRLYPTLDEASRKRVEAALLKENPRLSGRDAFRPGVVVTLPTLPDIKPKPGIVASDPVDDMRDTLTDVLARYQKYLDQRINEALDDATYQEGVLDRRDVIAAIKEDGDASLLAKTLNVSLKERKKSLTNQRKAQAELFARIQKDLGTMG